MTRNFKKGDNIIYLGTKEGRTDSMWERYFGNYGIKKGSTGVIAVSTSSDKNIFVNNDGRPTTDGCLFACDLELVKPKDLKAPTHIVIWEIKGCGDPCKFFIKEPEAKDFIKALSEDKLA